MRVPNFKEPGLTDFLVRMDQDNDRQHKAALKSLQANDCVFLYSPSKKVYAIKVDDSGVISATLVSG